MASTSRPPLAKVVSGLTSELATISDRTTRQIRLLQVINQYTGSTFTGFNINDALGRFMGAVAWPVTPELLKTTTELGPTLSALLVASPLHQLLWDFGPRAAFEFPPALLHATQAYQHAYKAVGMHYIGWYDYPADKDGNHVIVAISRGDRSFTAGELRALQTICDEFESHINAINAGGPFAPRFSEVADHSVELDANLRPKSLSPYAQALIALFYGRLPSDGHLPAELLADIRRTQQYYSASVMPVREGFYYSFTKHSQGRLLCATMLSADGETMRLMLYEDLKQLERIRKVKDICRNRNRDRYSMFIACLAVLDGADDAEIRRRAGLANLREGSAKRIVSGAKTIVEGV